MHQRTSTHIIRTIALFVSAMSLQACDTVAESMQVKTAQLEPTLRLTIVAPRGYEQNTPNTFLIKASDSKSRALLRKEDTDTFTLFILDEDFHQLHVITPEPENVSGLYQFNFTPKAAGYRIWAEVTPSGNQTQYPYETIGAKVKSQLEKKQIHNAQYAGTTYTLTLSDPLRKYRTSDIQVLNASGTPMPIMGIIGFYEDFQHVYRHKETDRTPEFSPQYTGFIKLFVQVKTAKGIITLPFTSEVTK